MSSVVISGDTSGAITVTAPTVAGTYTQTLPQITGTLGTLNSGTAVASTSGTSIDFTSIPANVRRITVMFNQVSVSGTSNKLIQIGAGSVTSTGYVSSGGGFSGTGSAVTSSTSGFPIQSDTAATGVSGHMVITLVSGNLWVSSHAAAYSTVAVATGGGSVTLGGTLDRVRITTVNGTDTFDAGSINILYE